MICLHSCILKMRCQLAPCYNRKMVSVEEKVEARVEKVLRANSVQKAQEVIRSRSGLAVLATISFIESALPVPILTDPFLVAAILVDRARAVRLVLVTMVTSVLGGLCAYFMATFFFEFILQWMTPAMAEEFHALAATNGGSALALTLVGAVTPIPYTIVAWVVAVLEGSLLAFIVASVLGRGFRYTIVGYASYRFGPAAVSWARRYIGIASILLVLLVALYFWIKL